MKCKILVCFVAVFLFSSCQKDGPVTDPSNGLKPNLVSNFDSEIIRTWNDLYLTIEKDLSGFRPSATSRAIGYIQLAAYETCVPGMPGYISNSTYQKGLKIPELKVSNSDINWNVALNACYSTMLRQMMLQTTASQNALIAKTESEMNTHLRSTTFGDVFDNSVEWGRSVAQSVLVFAGSDEEGYSQVLNPFPASYVPPTGQGKWEPTAPNFTPALFPYWGKARVFAARPEDLVSPEPLPFSTSESSEYYRQHKQLNDMVTNLTHENRWIAEFWSDDIVGLTFSPPARLIAIANQMLILENMNLADGLHLYCKLGLAINDASVAAWNSKYIYNTERPETYIKKYINPGFESILGEAIGKRGIEPPFPGYPSGHSTFGGVQAGIFNEFFGPVYTFTDNCHKDRTEFLGQPRTFTTWNQMAEENAYSRIPLGVHIKMDCDEGLRLGHLIAARVNAYKLRYN